MIRQATLNDHPAIRNVYHIVWPTYQFTPLPNEVDFVAEKNGRIVGVVRFVHEYGGLIRRGRAVLPEFRGQGIGHLLIKAVHQEAGGRPYFSLATVESAHQSSEHGFINLNIDTVKVLLNSIETLQALVARADEYHRDEEQRYLLLFQSGVGSNSK